MRNELSASDIAAFAPSEKIGLVATVDGDGGPRVSLLTTVMANGPRGLTVGEFSRGESKRNMAARHQVGFLVMGLDRRLWRGTARWTRLAKEGREYEAYNRQPMFRYNTYFGIDTVHYLDLESVEGPSPLPMGGIVLSSLATMARAGGASRTGAEAVMPPAALAILDRLSTLSFLCHVDAGGWPRLVPVVQARSAGASRIVFTPGPYGKELAGIEEGERVAVFTMTLGMESFLSRGSYRKMGGGLLGVDLDWLYNSAPPAHGQVYPRPRLGAALMP